MKLRSHEQILLDALKARLTGGYVPLESAEDEQIRDLFALAQNHKLLPMVYEAVAGQSSLHDPRLLPYKRQAVLQVMRQTQLSQAALSVYEHLHSCGLHPLILKGAVCRRLYPSGDHRISGDEDLYIPKEELEQCCSILSQIGLKPDNPGLEGWTDPTRSVHIELHRELFPSGQIDGSKLERFFRNGFAQPYAYEVEPGRWVESFDPHLHFLYLILHAYKHFLFSGFGIRQVCDIGLWAKVYENEIQWEWLRSQLVEVKALNFAGAILRIARDTLGIDLTIPEDWDAKRFDPQYLLRDILDAGIYGSATSSRSHSAIALGDRKGRSIHTLFPDSQYMMRKYPQWNGKGYMLPVMWARRLGEYGVGVLKRKEDPLEAISIAKERQKLLKYYKIL